MALLRYYDFFAGAGLVDLGLDPPWECVWANDIDPKKAEVYQRNLGSAHFHLRDVADVSASDLPRPVEMAWASFPCQDLSLAGWRRGMSAKRSGTFWAFWRIMRDLYDSGQRPPLVVIENVVGLLHGNSFIGLCESLAALGLQFGALMLDARWFVPQSRPRVFVVAVDSRVDCRGFTIEQPLLTPWFPKAVYDAWSSLPCPLSTLWRWWLLPHKLPGRMPAVDELIEDDPDGVLWHDKSETQYLLDMMAPQHLRKVHNAAATPGRKVGFLYRRIRQAAQRAEVRFDGLAGCLRTPQGGSSRQTVVIVSGKEVRSRLLSPREAARLMGVPDSYSLPRSYNDGYRAMGDGVAVPVVRWLSQQLLAPLAHACSDAESCLSNTENGVSSDQIAESRRTAEELARQWSTGI